MLVSPFLKISAIVLLVSLMLDIGFNVNRDHLRAVLTNYGLLARTFVANFVAVPIYGVLLVRAFHLSSAIAVGILLMSIAPGGRGIVLSGGRKKGGSLGFAVTLAFILPALSIVTIPITAYLILPSLHIVTRNLIFVLALFQLVPLLAGMWLNDRAPETAAKLKRALSIFVLLMLAIVIVPLVPALVRSVATIYGSRGILAIVSIVVLSIITGWILGGRQREFRRTLGLGTALRSFAFCAAIAATNFPGTAVSAAVLTYFVIQMVVTAIVGVYFQRTAKFVEAPA